MQSHPCAARRRSARAAAAPDCSVPVGLASSVIRDSVRYCLRARRGSILREILAAAAREKPELPEVHADDRHVGPAEEPRGTQQRAVAAERKQRVESARRS